MNRRRFLVGTTGTALAALLPEAGKAARDRGSLSASGTPGGPLITPVGQFHVYSQNRTPAPRPANIQFDGLIGQPRRYDESDLAGMPRIRTLATEECYVNTAGGPMIYATQFEGIPFSGLLQALDLKPNAQAMRVETNDGHAPFLIPLSELRRPGSMLAVTMGGAPVSLGHGSPYTRVFIPGVGGNHDPKWVNRITFTADQAPEHPAPTMAGFLFPSPPETLGSLAGVILTGYAFAGSQPVASVELSTDAGTTWQRMPLPAQEDPYLWITWQVRWRPPERGFYVLRVRATGAGGDQQTIPGTIAVEVR